MDSRVSLAPDLATLSRSGRIRELFTPPRHSLIKSAVLQFPLITEGDKGVKKYKQSLERRFCILGRRPPVPFVSPLSSVFAS